jgi:hypothetical protein
MVPLLRGYDPRDKTSGVEVSVWEQELVLDKDLGAILKGCNSAQSGGV